MVVIEEDAYLAHYGILRKSGRYPWGSGQTSEQRSRTYLGMVQDLRRQGMSDQEIVQGLGLSSTTDLRNATTLARNAVRQSQIKQAQKLHDKGMSGTAAAKQMGIPEATYRTLLAPGAKDRAEVLTSVADVLREEVKKSKYVDVGAGNESNPQLNVSPEKMRAALALLKEEGYQVHTGIKVPQLGTGKDTTLRVLVPPGVTWAETARNRDKIKLISAYSDDGQIFRQIHPPISISPRRVSVKYAEDGGHLADGVIYVRRGVPDVSLGQSNYAQVRIKVGDGHYLKGMAMYKDDMPAGSDLVFNTAKSKAKLGPNKLDAMKKLEPNPDFPFGAQIRRQIPSDPHDKNSPPSSAMNIVHEEGDWKTWSKTLSSQFLSKQNPAVAREQLAKKQEERQREFDDIMSLTNPAVRKKLLQNFADETDSSAVHLEAAALHSKQMWHAILPLESIKEHQVYAPNYENGTKVVLVRYPHAGPFEIPELTVNNRHRDAVSLLGNAQDAVGIHPNVAKRLSGADFDGDTVLVIPNNSGKIRSVPMLEKLKDFEPHTQYKKHDGMVPLGGDGSPEAVKKGEYRKQIMIGDVSNLITDMTLKGASHDDIVRAVKHSMVVIDAVKHELDYKQSYIDNGIAALKAQYQDPSPKGGGRGASTLISRATSRTDVLDRKARPSSEGGPINKETGRLEFVPTGRTRIVRNKKGDLIEVDVTQRSQKLKETDDAFDLVSSMNTPMERIYAEHSNSLKALANKARLAQINTPAIQKAPSAAKVYASEVASMNAKLTQAKMNAPRERQAQIIANAQLKQLKDANPHLDKDLEKKLKYQYLEEARARMHAKKVSIEFNDREWQAIQAGAVSNSMLNQMLNNAKLENVRELARPINKPTLTNLDTSRAQAMLDSGHTRAEVAKQLGVSLSTLDRSMKGEQTT